jgi:hypothetical protein
MLEKLDTLLVKTDGKLFYSLFENKISQDSKQETNLLASFPEARRQFVHSRVGHRQRGLCFFDCCDKTWDGSDSVGCDRAWTTDLMRVPHWS